MEELALFNQRHELSLDIRPAARLRNCLCSGKGDNNVALFGNTWCEVIAIDPLVERQNEPIPEEKHDIKPVKRQRVYEGEVESMAWCNDGRCMLVAKEMSCIVLMTPANGKTVSHTIPLYYRPKDVSITHQQATSHSS
eukprot:Ihof_evm2s768 gene=Ihof_evmTU2s768